MLTLESCSHLYRNVVLPAVCRDCVNQIACADDPPGKTVAHLSSLLDDYVAGDVLRVQTSEIGAALYEALALRSHFFHRRAVSRSLPASELSCAVCVGVLLWHLHWIEFGEADAIAGHLRLAKDYFDERGDLIIELSRCAAGTAHVSAMHDEVNTILKLSAAAAVRPEVPLKAKAYLHKLR